MANREVIPGQILSFHYAFEDPAAQRWRVTHAWGDGGLYDYRFEYLDALNERRKANAEPLDRPSRKGYVATPASGDSV